MASFNNLAPQLISKTSTSVLVEVPIPYHVIIYNRMSFQDWKNCFAQKMREAALDEDKFCYAQCIKTMQLAELCNNFYCAVKNSKGDRGLAVNFYFEFLYPEFLEIFLKNLESIPFLASQPT